MPVTERTYDQIALADPDRLWEMDGGRLREKPATTWDHDDVMVNLGQQLLVQLDRKQFRVRINSGRLRRSSQHYSIPDIAVIPVELSRPFRGRMDVLAVFSDPLPFVAEVWSPSTGGYDVDTKLPEYQLRGDLEIWRLHPFARTVKVWRRQADGRYAETIATGGLWPLIALPGVTIDVDAVFDV